MGAYGPSVRTYNYNRLAIATARKVCSSKVLAPKVPSPIEVYNWHWQAKLGSQLALGFSYGLYKVDSSHKGNCYIDNWLIIVTTRIRVLAMNCTIGKIAILAIGTIVVLGID